MNWKRKKYFTFFVVIKKSCHKEELIDITNICSILNENKTNFYNCSMIKDLRLTKIQKTIRN